MSLLAVQGGATGSGTVTLLAPVTNTNRTLTLPDVSGTVAVQGGTGVGKVLQVVNATYATQTSSSSSTFADTGLTASITPSSVSSKILVFANVSGIRKTTNNTWCELRLLKNSTVLFNMESSAGRNGSVTDNAVGSSSTTYLDSPATTSATIYKVQFSSANNNTEAIINVAGNTGSTSTITLMEISA